MLDGLPHARAPAQARRLERGAMGLPEQQGAHAPLASAGPHDTDYRQHEQAETADGRGSVVRNQS